MTYNIINIDLSHPRIDEVYNLVGNNIKVINATSDCFIQFDGTTQDPINLFLVDEIKIKFTKFYISNVGIKNQSIKIVVSENFSLCDRISISDYIPEPIQGLTPTFLPVQIINITNPEPNVQLELDLNRLNFKAFNSTGSNIRIIDENHNPLPFYLYSFNKTAKTGKLYFKTPNSIINSAFIFDADLDATSVSNSNATFEFFDDFKGTAIDATKWNIVDATGWSVGNGELRGSNTSGRLLSQSLFSSGIVLEIKVRPINSVFDSYNMGGFWVNTGNGINIVHMASFDHIRNNGTWVNISNIIPVGIDILLQFIVQPATVNIKITRLDTNIVIYDAAHTNSVINESIMLGKRPDNSNVNRIYDTRWDWVMVRKDTLATAMII